MKRRKGDLWWATPPAVLGLGGVMMIIGLAILIALYCTNGRYLEAILTTTIGILLFLLMVCDLLGEIIGSIRDLNDVLKGREKEDPKKPA